MARPASNAIKVSRTNYLRNWMMMMMIKPMFTSFDKSLKSTFALTMCLIWTLMSVPGWAADDASIARGGRLFDNWFLELKDRPPLNIHPKYRKSGLLYRQTASSWRCVTCHGWDYRGRAEQGTGAISGKTGADPVSLAAILKNKTHLYNDILSERDLVDLAAFIGHGVFDMSQYVEPESNRILGDPKREIVLYATICANCHGANGQRITSIAPLGVLVHGNPREALHKILNGHPAERMPPLRFLSTRRIGDLLAYVDTLPGKHLSASIARGGRLYDNWQKETGAEPKSYRHPAYPREAAYATSPKTNWRCKECHGWDYKGSNGIYGQGRRKTGIKGIREKANSNPKDIIVLIMDANHRYHGSQWFRSPLEFQDLIDLGNFISQGQIDMDVYIDRKTGVAIGDPKRRKNEFDVLCATCHGKNGDALPTGKDIGDVARENPWETLHKIRNGHPDEAMPALHSLDMKMLVDILAYAQTLPR